MTNNIYEYKDWKINNLKGQINFRNQLLSLTKKQWENIHQANKRILEAGKKHGYQDFQPISVKEYLARKQFYRQNNLPVELNLMIEEAIATDYSKLCQSTQENYKRLTDNDKEEYYYLKEIFNTQREIQQIEQETAEMLDSLQEALNTEIPSIQELREKVRKEKEIEELLAKEIKEYQAKWEQYLATKPLPELPKKQSKIKVLGNKLKAEIGQATRIKLPKPSISSFNFLLIGKIL